MSEFSMATGLITMSWPHFKDFIERYTSLQPYVKWATDGDTYLVIVPSDGYAYRSVIEITDPSNPDQLDFEQYFSI